MTSSATALAPVADPSVRGSGEADVLALLTGPQAREPLSLAVTTIGAEVTDHRVHSVQHRPGDGVTVGYRVWVRHDCGAVVEDYVLLSSTAGRDVPSDAPNVVRMEGPSGRLLGWLHPHDPALPGLGVACDPVALEQVLPGSGPVTSLALVGYRPLRRAVVRAVRDDVTSYVKVLRPTSGRGGAPDVVHRHRLLTAAGVPVPRVLSATSHGLVVLEEARGRPLVEAIGADGARGVTLGDLTGILDALPAQVLDLARRAAWSDRARDYANAVAASGTDAPGALALGRAVRERSAAVDLGPVVPTHGDFHEGQLTARREGEEWRPGALLDVDTLGPGHRVDDLACLVAHAVALGPAGAEVVRRWEGEARAVVDPEALDVRTAGVLLSLAAGAAHERDVAMPTRALLDAAEERLER
ncbi:hypothetical protein GCM10023168_29360 [Fodinibacter luteus]|uniref:Aminoglycoside phosphotransferase domain-containing protein n=1 Tax=Fodinibacter luteus TaxID=552064 RepID=A0ABP8KLJ5_9MICO